MRWTVLLSLILLFLEIQPQVVNLLIVKFHSSGIQEVMFLEDQIVSRMSSWDKIYLQCSTLLECCDTALSYTVLRNGKLLNPCLTGMYTSDSHRWQSEAPYIPDSVVQNGGWSEDPQVSPGFDMVSSHTRILLSSSFLLSSLGCYLPCIIKEGSYLATTDGAGILDLGSAMLPWSCKSMERAEGGTILETPEL